MFECLKEKNGEVGRWKERKEKERKVVFHYLSYFHHLLSKAKTLISLLNFPIENFPK